MDCQVQPQQQPPVRSLPASAASPPPNHALRSRRRTSLPASVKTGDSRPANTAAPAASKRNSNTIRTQAASPQVISSLIDQLSAISIPAHNHFENLLVGYDSLSVPPSPSLRSASARTSFAPHDGAPVDPAAHYHQIREQNDLYPDDACEPPVIRTSKPPSGLSPLTAPKKRDKPHSLSSYLGRSGGSSASLHSTHSVRSVSSFGNISIEAPPQRPPPTDSNRSSVESKRSAKAHRSLMYMSSRERLRLKETDRKRTTVHCLEDVTRSETGRKLSTQLFPYEDTIKEEPSAKEEQSPGGESSKFSHRYSSTNISPRRIRLNLVDGPQGASPTEKGLIPERGSSLRHTGSPPRKNRRSCTDESIRESPRPTNMAVQGAEKKPEEAKMTDQFLKELEQKEDNVAQRIRELKEQKMRRDKLAGKMPVDSADAGAPPTPPRVSPFASPEPSPTSTVSSPSEIRVQDSTKAHKVLGIATRKAALQIKTEKLVEQSPVGEAEPVDTAQTRSLRHSRHRSLTVNDGYDLTPLPIDYALALQHLEESALRSPPLVPPHESSPPIDENISIDQSSNTDIATKRRSATMFNARPTMGRRASTTSGAIGSTGSLPGHKHSSSATEATLNIMPLPFRSASEEITTRHQSMRASSSPPSSLKLQRRRTLTKKRWSHPDLPANAEKEPREKLERRSDPRAGAVQIPSNPVIEERPASLDSIDVDVDSYLDSPRLSQKIRHPQTGRIISFSEVGDPQGYAIFVCVGMGLTRYVMAFYDQLATTLKLRLITPDRPGIGGSQVDPNGTPLSWPDDVLVICQALKINKFSLLAHSAGAVYALATSLRMPQHIRGRVHLLAPWIPPSQMAPIGISQDSPPTQQLPRSQRFLRALPPSLLKVANSTFLSASSASLQRTGPKNSPKTKRKSTAPQAVPQPRPSLKEHHRHSMMMMDQVLPNASSLTLTSSTATHLEESKRMQEALTLAERERQHAFDERLTFAIWDRATANANPATDLIVCLETKQTIGFRYEDINRPVVIHHGSKDSRVPVDNVRWLGRLMRKCEVRILEGEPHGLMASAQVMGNVLTEMASDWEDWTSIVNQKPAPASGGEHRTLRRRTSEKLRSQLSMAA